MLTNAEIDIGLLKHTALLNRKVMRVVCSFFEDIDYRSSSELLWGSGERTPDALLERCIERIKRLGSDGVICIDGDPSLPRYSEIRLVGSEPPKPAPSQRP
jgi:hypothetical protein